MPRHRISDSAALLITTAIVTPTLAQWSPPTPPHMSLSAPIDTDRDGIPDECDTCPRVIFDPGFDWKPCAPMDLNPDNDPQPECKARERVARLIFDSGVFVTRIAMELA